MKKLLWIVLILVLAGVIYALFLWFKPHRDIEGEAAVYEMPAATLLSEFTTDETAANQKYIDQVVELQGVVDELGVDYLKLQSGIYCRGDFAGAALAEGDQVNVKGRVLSFDELFGEVRLDNCTLD